jgi:hypothetical protein
VNSEASLTASFLDLHMLHHGLFEQSTWMLKRRGRERAMQTSPMPLSGALYRIESSHAMLEEVTRPLSPLSGR